MRRSLVATSAGEERGEDDVQHGAGGSADEVGQESEHDTGGRLPVVRRHQTAVPEDTRPRPHRHVSLIVVHVLGKMVRSVFPQQINLPLI